VTWVIGKFTDSYKIFLVEWIKFYLQQWSVRKSQSNLTECKLNFFPFRQTSNFYTIMCQGRCVKFYWRFFHTSCPPRLIMLSNILLLSWVTNYSYLHWILLCGEFLFTRWTETSLLSFTFFRAVFLPEMTFRTGIELNICQVCWPFGKIYWTFCKFHILLMVGILFWVVYYSLVYFVYRWILAMQLFVNSWHLKNCIYLLLLLWNIITVFR